MASGTYIYITCFAKRKTTTICLSSVETHPTTACSLQPYLSHPMCMKD